MPRRPRTRVADVPQIVSLRGHNDDPVFKTNEDYATFLSCMDDASMRNNVDVHAWCLVPNRVAVLCTPVGDGDVSTFVQDVSRRYVPFYNARHGRSGALWNGRFRAALVEPTGYVVTAYQFVETLAVRAGLTKRPEHHRNSSFHTNVSGRSHPLLHPHPMFSMLMGGSGNGRHEYQRICHAGLSSARSAEVEHAIHHGLVIGCERFKEKLNREYGVKVKLGRPGRPRNVVQPQAQPA